MVMFARQPDCTLRRHKMNKNAGVRMEPEQCCCRVRPPNRLRSRLRRLWDCCRRQQWRLIQQRCRRRLRRSDCRCVHPCCGLQLARIASACKSCCRTCKHHSNAYSYQVYYFINYATVHVYILYIKPCKSQWSKHVIFRLRPKLQSAHNELTI